MAAFQPWHPLVAADEASRALGHWLLAADGATFVPCPVDPATAHAVRAQVEFYFSPRNLETDAHLVGLMTKRKDRAGAAAGPLAGPLGRARLAHGLRAAPVSQINAFKRMRAIGASDYEVASCLAESELVAVSANGLTLWPRAGLPQSPPEGELRRMAIAEHLAPGTHDDVAGRDSVQLAFARHGAVDAVRVFASGAAAPVALPLPGKLRRSRQAFAVVTFREEGDAERAVQALRKEEQRSGGWRSRAIAAALLRPRTNVPAKGKAPAAPARGGEACTAGVTFRKPGDLRQALTRGGARSRARAGKPSAAAAPAASPAAASAAGPGVGVARGPRDGCGFKRVRSLPL